jgi:uncharacterized protein
MHMKRFFIPLALVAVASFVQANDVETIRICDASGCSDRPKNTSTFQAEAEDPALEQRTLALVEMARDDPRAAWDLGLRYFRGDGVRRNSHLALKWMRDAAERGNADAQLAVGRFYLLGLEEMGSDPGEAESWLSMAAAKGHKEAKTLLAQAQEAKKSEQAAYQWRETYRKNWYGYWYSGYPYYWAWGPSGWHFR